METHLPSLPLMKIFSYLDAYSLLQVAQVNKNWNALASSDVLWRKLCQKRWLFCDMVTLQLQDKETWKQFFVYRTWQEHSKTRANPRDFTYKEIPLQYGPCGYACYISGCGITRKGQDKSVVCMVNSKNTISTWDVHKSVITWVSPEQPASIKLLTTLPEMHIAVTVDIQSTIKLWDCHNREALATNILESPCKSLKAVITKDDPIVLDPVHVIVTCNDGSLDVYAWEERSLLLRKCYRLKNRRHLSPRGFINKTLCDDVSIIQLMIDGHDTWFLMAYALNICS
ncbi:F-box and WD-40 domain protein 27 isoform X1 [Mus musculus]|uniref:F-box and WD-40 domain protein 27 isoform X1 n=1 Tax=Mus musculus TaxID=10090 RepID=UPI000060623F|nr:F-box and WD-40 domain protein 27 isoform X1 [Mus musculus]|eukprot:XP_001481072.1 PREDICTED: F-box and WD-40 domain protein 27 isoform X1 [Mus musculus]